LPLPVKADATLQHGGPTTFDALKANDASLMKLFR
jgi:hypothetical protein